MCTAARGFEGLSIWRCDEHLCSGWRYCAWHSWSSLAERERIDRRAPRWPQMRHKWLSKNSGSLLAPSRVSPTPRVTVNESTILFAKAPS